MCGEAPIESSKEDPEGVFFFFSLSLSLRQETKKKAAQVISFVQIFLPPSTDLPTRYSTTRNSFIDGDESDKACRLGLSSPTLGNWRFILECDLSFSFFFFFTRSFYVYCMTGPLWPDYANGQTSNRYHARGKQKRDIPEKCKERKRKRKWNEMEKETLDEDARLILRFDWYCCAKSTFNFVCTHDIEKE